MHPPWTCSCGTTDNVHAADCPDAPARCGLCGEWLVNADVAYCEGFAAAYCVSDADACLCADCAVEFGKLHCVTCGRLKPIASVREQADECPECLAASAERLARKRARRTEWIERWIPGVGA